MVGAEARLSLVIAYRRYRNRFLLGLAAIGTLCVFVAYHLYFSEMLVYAGLAALVGASIWLVFESRRCSACEEARHPVP